MEPSRVSLGALSISWQWVSDEENVATIGVVSSRDGVTLKYKSRSYGEDWSDVEHHVPISWTPCRFGGERPWFACSAYGSGKSAARCCQAIPARQVICVPSLPRPRLCQPTRSLQPTRPLPRSKIGSRLGGSVSMFEDFPDKPKGMHWRTYDRLRGRYDMAEARSMAGLERFLNRLDPSPS